MNRFTPNSTTLRNHWNNEVAFRISLLQPENLHHTHRLATYTFVWVRTGHATLQCDNRCYRVGEHTMMFFSPFQPFCLRSDALPDGSMFHFSNEFFCLEKHRHEVACNGVLFDNPYAPPCFGILPQDAAVFQDLQEKMLEAFASPHDFAREEILKSYLKIWLVNACRIYLEQTNFEGKISPTPPVLQLFKTNLDQYYIQKHAPSDYADLLNLGLKTLAKLTKKYYNKTPGEIISEKIMMEAKRILYLNDKTIKEISYELGFEDHHYFSRFFKKNAGISAEEYRKQVGTLTAINTAKPLDK